MKQEPVTTVQPYVGVAFRLSEELRSRLREHARENGVTVSTFLRLVLQDAIDREMKIETAVLVLTN